jgi:hypothetical protein
VGWFDCGSLMGSSVLDGRRCSIKGGYPRETGENMLSSRFTALDPKLPSAVLDLDGSDGFDGDRLR